MEYPARLQTGRRTSLPRDPTVFTGKISNRTTSLSIARPDGAGRGHCLFHAADHEHATGPFRCADAARTEWKKLLVDSTFTLALLTGMSVRTVSAKVAANLVWDKVRAVLAGDTLYTESKVLHRRESKSRPTQVIVTVLTRGLNQEGCT